MTAKHHYPPGWLRSHQGWLSIDEPDLHIWGYVDNEMSAWRFCPVCGARLLSGAEAIISEPRCSRCDRPIEACPCACETTHDPVRSS
jgi:hypothetical protein